MLPGENGHSISLPPKRNEYSNQILNKNNQNHCNNNNNNNKTNHDHDHIIKIYDQKNKGNNHIQYD